VTQAELTRLFSQALFEVGGRALICSSADLAATLVALIDSSTAGVPVLVDAALCDVASELSELGVRAETVDVNTPRLDFAGTTVGITGALAGIAETGTVVIGPGKVHEGILATLSPHHVAVLRAELIQPNLASALAALARQIIAGSRLVFVTGPSRTSDIELTPVIGVHGPLRLDVVVVDDGMAAESRSVG
jgi:L-lactate utilization protein LutC